MKYRLILIGLLLCALCSAQSARRNRFAAFKETSLSGAAEAVTIQQPSSNARTVFLEAAQIYCSVACVVELERGGTAASTTALTPIAIGNQGQEARATAFHTSNVGNGTTITEYNLAAGETVGIDLNGMLLEGSSTAENVTLRTDSITGTVKLTFIWWEN